ncbi:carbon storage regulator [Fervidicella metallireducens AeB]|uniref:Translational regulator CsrA n=1 Tax=Fervidicella metallireducens AeB TaxID=1403537 RepID=A0A017RVG9_9CLOT|nr:carbon storage regulator [Fervidicella metallireducens]EYE88778.1 carbon storage regulator [Fervidicella metallireducens AeB]
MLVLKRKPGESLLIGEEIEITVVETSNGSVKLSINAPANIKIIRKELVKEIGELNRQSIDNLEILVNKREV